jgi:16S rRNA (cytidine1402-2'-O)-methyltransferase
MRTTPPRGEFVIVVGEGTAKARDAGADLDARLLAAMATLSVKDASAVVAAEAGLPRRDVYARALRLQAR